MSNNITNNNNNLNSGSGGQNNKNINDDKLNHQQLSKPLISSSTKPQIDASGDRSLIGLLLQGIDKWPFGESSLTELLILKQEQERTKQEQIKLENLEKSIQLLSNSINAKIPPPLIPNLFTGGDQQQQLQNQQQIQYQQQPTFATSTPPAQIPISASQSSLVAASPWAANATSRQGASLMSPNNSGSFQTLSPSPSFINSTMKNPPTPGYRTHQRSTTISSTKDLYSHNNSANTTLIASSSPVNAKLNLRSPKSTNQHNESITNQYITHSSPFKFPSKIHSTIPESHPITFNNTTANNLSLLNLQPVSPNQSTSFATPKSPTKIQNNPGIVVSPNQVKAKPSIPTNKNNEPVGMSSFQHVIQFHHWQLEDPAAMIRKEQQKSKDDSDSSASGHKRRKSNPEAIMSRSNSISKVTKPSNNGSVHTSTPTKSNTNNSTTKGASGSKTSNNLLNKTKRKLFSHSRARSEIIQSKSMQDFARFQVGKDNILNRDDDTASGYVNNENTNINANANSNFKNIQQQQQDKHFNPLNSLASAAVLKDQQQQQNNRNNAK